MTRITILTVLLQLFVFTITMAESTQPTASSPSSSTSVRIAKTAQEAIVETFKYLKCVLVYGLLPYWKLIIPFPARLKLNMARTLFYDTPGHLLCIKAQTPLSQSLFLDQNLSRRIEECFFKEEDIARVFCKFARTSYQIAI